MRIKEMIANLQKVLSEHGNIDIMQESDECGGFYPYYTSEYSNQLKVIQLAEFTPKYDMKQDPEWEEAANEWMFCKEHDVYRKLRDEWLDNNGGWANIDEIPSELYPPDESFHLTDEDDYEITDRKKALIL